MVDVEVGAKGNGELCSGVKVQPAHAVRQHDACSNKNKIDEQKKPHTQRRQITVKRGWSEQQLEQTLWIFTHRNTETSRNPEKKL